jgi:hypothetical protein
MMNKISRVKYVMVGLVLMGLITGGFALLMAQPSPTTPRDPLTHLKRALSAAGAPALTTQQEDQLNSLITAFQANRPKSGPDATIQAAQQAYDNAILAGDLAAAQVQVTALANQMTAHMTARLQVEAGLKVQIVNSLKTNGDQLNLLVQHFGAEKVSRMLGMFAGFGRRGPGPDFKGGRGFGGGREPGMGPMKK